MKVFGIQSRLTTAYHPQANRLDERLNQTLVNSLVMFARLPLDFNASKNYDADMNL